MPEFVPIHQRERSHMTYVTESPRKEAMKRLHERLAAGESAFEILGIEERESYYVNKIVAGLCPISYAMYGRIMNLDEEDDFSE